MPPRKRKSSGGDTRNKKGKTSATCDDIWARDASARSPVYLEEDSVFCELLTAHGVRLTQGDSHNELTRSAAMVQRDLNRALRGCTQVVEEFLEGVTSHIDAPRALFWALMPCIVAADADTSAPGGQQSSIIRLLLGVELLQAGVMSALLEKLAEWTGDEEPIVHNKEKVDLPRLVTAQLRWLDHVVDSGAVTRKMLDILCVVGTETQRDIITCLPEVVGESDQGVVVAELVRLLGEKWQQAVPILDALSNLHLEAHQVTEVRARVMTSLGAVAVGDLPVIVRFLLQTLDAKDSVPVITELRTRLDLSAPAPPFTPAAPSQTTPRATAAESRSSEALTLDAIKSGIQFQKCQAEAWLAVLGGVAPPAQHRPLDLLLVLLLHAAGRRKGAESLLRGKVRAGLMAPPLLATAMTRHAPVVRDYFPSLMALADALLRSPERVVSGFGVAMYRTTFAEFDMFCRQEVVAALVTHIGSGCQAEVDAALDVLRDLVRGDVARMAPFTVFVKGVLDYLDNLSIGQIRKIYGVLSTLAFRGQGEGGIQDEIHIIIRKQLSHAVLHYKLMGVLGAATVIGALAGDDDAAAGQAVTLATLVMTSCARHGAARALFLDELADLLREDVHATLRDWVQEHVFNEFQDDFVVDVEPGGGAGGPCGGLGVRLGWGLDPGAEICIRLLPLLHHTASTRGDVTAYGDAPSAARPAWLACLAPSLRIMQLCERRDSPVLEGIDAVLGCPLQVPTHDVMSGLAALSQSQRSLVLDSLFFTVNWFRELVNAFATQEGAELRGKVITRLRNVVEVEGVLRRALLHAPPGYAPPAINAMIQDSVKAPGKAAAKKGGTKNSGGTTKTKKGGGRARPKKGAASKKKLEERMKKRGDDGDDDSSLSCGEDDASDKENEEDGGKEEGGGAPAKVEEADLTEYSCYFREFDLDVFDILKTGPGGDPALADLPATVAPEELRLLLQDLVKKLRHALPSRAPPTRAPLRVSAPQHVFCHLDQLTPEVVARRGVTLLPTLCQHLEQASQYFQELISENDGLLDGPGSRSPHTLQMSACFLLLLEAICSLLAWSSFALPHHKPLLRDALSCVASRIRDATPETPLATLVTQAYGYFAKLQETAPTLAAAAALVKLLTVVQEKTGCAELCVATSALCGALLRREWRDDQGLLQKGRAHHDRVEGLLHAHLSLSADPLASMEELCAVGVKELSDSGVVSATYPTLTKAALPVFYRALLTQLVTSARAVTPPPPSADTDRKMAHLVTWNIAVRLFHSLVVLVKIYGGRSNLGALLRHGRVFLEVFMKTVLPTLDALLRHHRDDVASVLKNVQLSTRYLHHVASHSKIVKDVALTNQVPGMKRVLERFVLETKAIFAGRGAVDAFWIGNLKNRNLQGEELVQEDSSGSSDEEGEGASRGSPTPSRGSQASEDGQSYSEIY